MTEWINAFDGKVKKLILIGATKEKIAADAEKCGFTMIMCLQILLKRQSISVQQRQPRPWRGSASVTGMCKLGNVPESMKYVEMNLKRIVNSL